MTVSLSPGWIAVPERKPSPQCGPNSDWMPWKSSAPPAIPAAVVAAWRRKPEPALAIRPGAGLGTAAAALPAGRLLLGAGVPCVGTGLVAQGPAEGTLPP